ncbi:MarR family transcriptional regulator [Streptomyces sp. 3MP-14]|uniref:MarR family transcriptional regulator n=1 Tax=Streptomyces mimosae TaxID=2586635 RepID=A0A5N6AAV1_9ACTN|nr:MULTISPECIES: MarR family winged helix-turn-helix transcriptional regulator [Streptomyces]KAB8164618.1 MarR family transcriptional regulator [Streptomyces mimosae]KAB8175534.1 MarR family transcriptional regulator [Streptomyces sp. 3MP-14]
MNESRRPPTLLGLPSYLAAHVGRIGNRPLVEELTAHGLRLPHFAVLAALRDLGPTAQHELADRLGFNRSHLVGYLDHLERAGLAVRERDADDRRRQLVRHTAEGARLTAELVRIAGEVERAQFAALTDAELATLTALLARVLAADDQNDRGTTGEPPPRRGPATATSAGGRTATVAGMTGRDERNP